MGRLMGTRSAMHASHFEGKWVRSASRADWGLAYCKASRGANVLLSYVDIPEVAERDVWVAHIDVINEPIPTGTRVWIRGTPYGWRAGVIDGTSSLNQYWVSLVDADWRGSLRQDQFYVRWSRPLEDPTEAVANGLVEAPIFFEARSALLTELVRQRHVSRGLSAAMAAPIELFQHQVDTAARVLADPVMRYLLADEVGLGKTIEAGIVIRQLVTENPLSRILVLCPDTLRGQWISELRNRLGLDTSLWSPNLTVKGHESIGALATQHPQGLAYYDLIVIDEAHNLFRHVREGSATESQFRRVDGLIALSATPMRGDMETFRRLLALVDPVAFDGTDLEGFKSRVEERERTASDLQVLTARRPSLRQKTSVLANIEADLRNDETVQALVAACRATDDPQDSSWKELADYVREIYRISRRMIRHRRTSDLTDAYAVAGRIPTFVDVTDPARPVIDEFLESYRRRLNPADLTFAQTVLHGLAGPLALRDHLATKLREPEGPLFERTIAQLELAGLEARLKVAAELTAERVTVDRRVVVSSSFANVLTRFEEILKAYVDARVTHCHYQSMPPEKRDQAVAHFLDGPNGAVLLADSSIEEGRNLQEAAVLVNLDLPLDANRLDQRIGRLDRFAVRPEPAEVVVLTEPTSPWTSAHIELLADGIGVLSESVSTVQRRLEIVLTSVTDDLVERGVDALNIEVASLRGDLEDEREAIDLIEELESIEAATAFDVSAFDDLLAYESDLSELRRAVRRLTTGSGSIALRPNESSQGVIKFGSAKSIGLPADKAESIERLLRPKAYDRRDAIANVGTAPFRVGDPLVDWLQDYLLADERGLATAFVRPVRGLNHPELWLHCEFLVEFSTAHSSHLLGPEGARLARRGEGHLQPLRLETWTDAAGPAPAHLVETVLGLPFDAKRDENLAGKIWRPVLESIPSWARTCARSADVAWDQVRSSPQLAEARSAALATAFADSDRRIAVLKARAARLPSGAERESARLELRAETIAAQALAKGIESPSIRLVSCGAQVIWPEENF